MKNYLGWTLKEDDVDILRYSHSIFLERLSKITKISIRIGGNTISDIRTGYIWNEKP